MPIGDLHFGGDETFAVPPERLFAALTNVDELVHTIPDLASHERVGDDELRCVVRPGFSFLRGTLRLAIHVLERQPPRSARMEVVGQGIGVSMRVVSQLAIEQAGSGSKLVWSADVDQLKGLISAVSPALIRAAAEQVIRSTWTRVRAQLGE